MWLSPMLMAAGGPFSSFQRPFIDQTSQAVDSKGWFIWRGLGTSSITKRYKLFQKNNLDCNAIYHESFQIKHSILFDSCSKLPEHGYWGSKHNKSKQKGLICVLMQILDRSVVWPADGNHDHHKRQRRQFFLLFPSWQLMAKPDSPAWQLKCWWGASSWESEIAKSNPNGELW